MSGQSFLSWSHYLVLLQVQDKTARGWYEKEAKNQTWSVRTLQRNVSTQYYYRLLKSQKKDLVEREMLQKDDDSKDDERLEFIKNPAVLEFLNIPEDNDYVEKDLENSLIQNMKKFLMELGKGYAFVAANRNGAYGGKKYDLIVGAVANDDVYRTLQIYFSGLLSKEQTIEALKIKTLFDQYVFASEESLSLLRFVRFERLR